MIQLLNFTTLNLSQKELILSWRNHPSVRKWMINNNEISLEDHLNFIDQLRLSTEKCYFLLQKESDYLGVINLTNITKESAELGIYAHPDMRGVGHVLMNALIDQASTLGLSKLIANVFVNNVRALRLYQKFDFIQTKHTHKKMITLERIL
ncbi:MAG: UDP-4-amino-4,6-dideoxy-N-acetyl-beta-L-altrosamine N-acetyltransferase [Epsilonproteobacteria bacterium]|nr:UDP-4-amino-4,6-dideoxy-N-acetyl-beta-L-altrosamine N-acetyltransferase [Campylobacterota bacterium]